uniref:MIF4G domain-containing protein n=1 Tax=Panagrolaimus sp. ES5 TaxID=591445 RepID=A0AC34GD05_9BILA
MEKENFKRLFHGAIIRKCQCSFETTALSHFQETTNKIQNEIQEEEQKDDKDEKKLTELNDRLEDLQFKEKRRMLGIIKFVSHLFRIGLLNYKIIVNCIVILIRNAEEEKSELMAEYAIEFMKNVGPYMVLRREDTSKLDGYVTYLDKFKPTVSNQVKFMIMDLADLRDNKWIDKRDLPKNMDEIDMYINKLAEKSRRDIIEQQQKNNANKPSIDKKDRLNAARLAASTSASAFKKDTSLLKIDQQRLGSTKNWEIANVNTNTPSANNKYLGIIIPQQSTDARQNSNDVRESAAHKENKSAIAPTPMIDSRSTSTTPPPTDPSSSRSQNNTPTVAPETEFNKGAFKTGFKERLQSFVDGTNVD